MEVPVESIRLEAPQMLQRRSDLKRPNVITAKRPKNVSHICQVNITNPTRHRVHHPHISALQQRKKFNNFRVHKSKQIKIKPTSLSSLAF